MYGEFEWLIWWPDVDIDIRDDVNFASTAIFLLVRILLCDEHFIIRRMRD